jgi:hypothetical protein
MIGKLKPGIQRLDLVCRFQTRVLDQSSRGGPLSLLTHYWYEARCALKVSVIRPYAYDIQAVDYLGALCTSNKIGT